MIYCLCQWYGGTMKKKLFIPVILLLSFLFAVSAFAEDCIPFNPDNCKVELIGGNWKITDGSMWLLDFGGNKEEAYKALEVIKHYRLKRPVLRGEARIRRWSTGLSTGRPQRAVSPGRTASPLTPPTSRSLSWGGTGRSSRGATGFLTSDRIRPRRTRPTISSRNTAFRRSATWAGPILR